MKNFIAIIFGILFAIATIGFTNLGVEGIPQPGKPPIYRPPPPPKPRPPMRV